MTVGMKIKARILFGDVNVFQVKTDEIDNTIFS